MYYNGFTEALCMGIKKKTLKSTFLFLLNLLTAIFLPLKRKKKKRLIKFPSSMKEAAGRNSEMINILYF